MNSPAQAKSANAARIHVDIISDLVCPWCWLGTRYFLTAAQRSPHIIELSWRAYMLDPDVPASGLPYRDYMREKFGDGKNNKFSSMRDFLQKAGPEAGINFTFSDIPVRPNTLNAHRLIRWAGGQKKATAMAERLFKAFFEDGLDIGDIKVLAKLGQEIGLDHDLLLSLLARSDDKEKVMHEIRYFRQLGIAGVPTFIYENQLVIQGAQSFDTHLKAMDRALNIKTEL